METPRLAIDPEDFGFDIIPAIEKSFGIEFTQVDLADVRTYGELCAAVWAKLPSTMATDCTSQQAFYKLRQSICTHTGAASITPATQLATLLPAQRAPRRAAAAAIEQELGMKLHLLGMPTAVETAGLLLFVLSLFAFLVGSFMLGATGTLPGLAGFAVMVVIFTLGSRYGTTPQYLTVRDIVLTMSSKHYRQSRRNPTTVNLREINSRLAQLFVDMAVVKLAELTPDAVLMSV